MKIRTLIISFFVMLLIGTLGYRIIEGWSFFDGFYMTAITITTVGFGEIHPLSPLGRVFTLGILFLGFGIAFSALSHIAASFLRGEIQNILGRKKMEKDVKRLTNHYILCGYGRMGKVIAKEFMKKSIPFVVIEASGPEMRGSQDNKRFPFIVGNANDEEILRSAGIERARGLVSAVSTDAENAFITMTARGLNPRLRIVARAGDTSSVNKLQLAGANKVVSPYIIGGSRIAQAMLNPALVDFIELATDNDSLEIEMAEIEIPQGSPFSGKALDHSEIKALELIIVSIQRLNHEMHFRPDAKTVLAPGDKLIAVGRPSQVQRMIERATP